MGKRPPDSPKPRFYIDEANTTPLLVERLQAAGYEVETTLTLGLRGTDDAEWIPQIAARGLVILTKDKRTRYNAVEIEAYKRAEAAAFILTTGKQATRELIAEAFILALKKIVKLCGSHNRPLVATVSTSGEITIKHGKRRGSVKKG